MINRNMLRKTKKGFTLVELLAVIVILAIILVIAVPKVMSIIEDAKMGTLESTAKMIASSAEKQNVQNTVLGKTDAITCDSVAKINKGDYANCSITFEDNTAKVTIEGKGKFDGLYVCNGTKTSAIATNESCGLRTLTVNLDGGSVNGDYNTKYEQGSTIMLIVPTRENYKFMGWEVIEGNSVVSENTLTIGTTNTIIKAKWELNVFNLSVDPNGGILSKNYNGEYVVGSTITLEVPTREGYTFTGWTSTSGSVSGNTFTIVNSDAVLTANWKEEVTTGASFLEGLLNNESTLKNGLIIDDTPDQNIRYAGAITNVKNKVYFNCAPTDGKNAYGSEKYNYEDNCELWRIIGIFDTKSTNSKTEEAVPRIKIVRDAMLDTTMEWDTTADGIDAINQWGETTLVDGTTSYAGASLKQYLNDGEGSYYNSLTSIAKGQISNALWYTGAVEDGTASEVYEDERSTATGTGTTVNYTTTWVGKIGLIYPSDFGYAGTNCGDISITQYASSCGRTSNWLTISSENYWSITSYAVFLKDVSCGVVSSGCVYCHYVDTAYGVRPTTYLSSNVQIIGGDGYEVPYKLK